MAATPGDVWRLAARVRALLRAQRRRARHVSTWTNAEIDQLPDPPPTRRRRRTR